VASTIAFTVGSHLVAENHVSLQWDQAAAGDIFAFGAGIFLSTATYFLGGEAERLIVGKFITVAELGCFSLALTLSSAPSQALSQVIGQVFYPMISRSIREDRVTAANHFKKAKLVFLVVSIFLGVGFVGFGQKIVAILLPSKFEMTGWMLAWLGFRAAQQIFVAPTSSLILAFGDSKYPAIANGVRLLLMVSGLWLAFTRFGLHEAIAVLAISSALAYLVLIPALIRHQPTVVWFELSSFALFLACMGVAATVSFHWHIAR
jgi:O-antigen/teichoic acid export membrane protein